VILNELFWLSVIMSDGTTVPVSEILSGSVWLSVGLSDGTTVADRAVPSVRYTQTATQLFIL
jgi:hypothetical protein